MAIIKSSLFWSLIMLLLLFLMFLTASLLFLFYPEAFSKLTASNDTVCPPEQFPCGDSYLNGTDTLLCLDRTLHCNTIADCPNGEDELNCADTSGIVAQAFNFIHEKLKNGTNITQEYAPTNCTIEMYFQGKCSCNLNQEKIVFCENSSLTEIPSNLSLDTTKLVLNNNSISQINVTILNQYSQLLSLYLDHNHIDELPKEAFKRMKKLKNLSLRGNQLTEISSHHFVGLSKLVMMYLENNRISQFDLSSLSSTPSLKLLVLGHNNFNLDGQRFPAMPQLSWLVLDRNKITQVDEHLFKNLPNLKTLHIKWNLISHITPKAFANNKLLQELDLSDNRIRSLHSNTFAGLFHLSKLDLQFNPLQSIPRSTFRNLTALESLDLRGITIDNIDIEHFAYNTHLQHLYFVKFRYCSYAPRVRICRPITDGLSSAEHLLVLPVLRYSVWVVALITCVGNIVVLVWRSVSKKEDHVLSLFIKNLSAADLVMGIYLCAIGAHDLAFRDNYRRQALSWMSSWSCTICGFLAMLSSQVSVFTLTVITIERYRCITANFRVVTIVAAKINLAIIWTLAIGLAFYPVAHWSTTGDRVFYASNGLCFPLHIDEPYMAGWQYSAFVFLGINFPAVLVIIILYIGMFCIIKKDRQHARPVFVGRKREDAVLALRFFGIVVTDCLCWIPIVIIKIMALAEAPISPNIYAWVVVFVLPINSALNPIIYTLAAPTEIRRRIYKWFQQTMRRVQCSLIVDNKSDQHSSSVISHTSFTGTTEVRSSNGSSVSLPMVVHSVHSPLSTHSKLHQTIKQIRL